MDFLFPDVGEGITEGKLVKWLVKEGDAVRVDQPVAKVETDKAVVEIPCPASGTVGKLNFKEGDTMHVGKVLMTIEGASDTKKQDPQKQQEAPAKKAMPHVATTAYNAEIQALPAARAYAKERNVDLGKIKGSGKEGRILKEDIDLFLGGAVRIPAESAPAKGVYATPTIRQLARDLNIDITTIKGSGEYGRITEDDLKKQKTAPRIEKTAEKLSVQTVSGAMHIGDSLELTPMRFAIAKHMALTHANVVPVTHMDEADVTALVKIRNEHKDKLKAQGIQLTVLPFFVKAAAMTLQHHPQFNAQLDLENKKIIVHKEFNMGIAVNTEHGLMVPVVRNVDRMSILAIAKEISALAVKARDRTIAEQDMKGSTFTITSVGSIGGNYFTPIINYPELAILGIGRIQEKPVVRNGQVVIRHIVPLSLTFDHRALDGADAAHFMNTFVEYVQDPDMLFMEVA